MAVESSRRAFLGGVVATAVAAGASPGWAARAYANPRPAASTRRRVAVLGGGLAGLTTALDLRDAGWDVVVLEARERVGGRVHTLYSPFTAGLHAESGGESIDDGHTAIQAMLKRFGLKTEHRPPTKPYDSAVYYQSMREPLAAFLTRNSGKALTDYVRFDDAVSALADGIDPEHPERAKNAEALDRQSLEDFVRAQHLVPEAEFLVRLENRAEYNAELRDISLLFVAQQEAVSSSSLLSLTGSETMRVTGGNSLLPEAMAKALGSRVRLGAAVTEIEHDNSGVRVHTTRGYVDAAWLVVAAPLMPVRRIRFTPRLPASMRRVVDGLDLGHAVKVIREYQVPFWKAEGSSGFTLTDLPFAVGWAPTDSQTTAVQGILSQFITGDAAVKAARLDEKQRRTVFGRQLDRVYPEGTALETGNVATMAWHRERYTGGGYAVYQPGQMAEFWPVLRNAHGRIRFAGEHTESLAGYMESAIRSGHRVAAAIGRAPRHD